MGSFLRQAASRIGLVPKVFGPGDDRMRLDGTYTFRVVYLENHGYEPGEARWFAFTAVSPGKQGPLLHPYWEGYYLRPTVLAGSGDTKEAAWESLAGALEAAYAAMVYNGHKPLYVRRPS